MAIAFSASASAGQSGGSAVASVTLSITCGASDTLLVANLMTNQAQTVTGMTYDGNAMTIVDSLAPAGNNHQYVYAYGGALSTSAKNVIITFSSALAFFDATVMTLSGSLSTIPTNIAKDSIQTNATSFTSTNPITTAVNNSWVVDSVAFGSNGGTMASLSSSTVRVQDRTFATGLLGTILKATAGSYTPGYTAGGVATNNWSIISFEVEPIAGAAANNPAFLLNFI
jgi:hypothetical protein